MKPAAHDAEYSIKKWVSEFRDQNTELKYLEWDFARSSTQLKIIVSLVLLLNLIFIRNDHVFFSLSNAFFLLLGIRLVFIAFSVVVFILVCRRFSKMTIRVLVPLWLFLTMLMMFSINLTRPSTYSMNSIFDIIFLFISYYLIPTRLSLKIAYSLAYSAGNILIFYLLRTGVPEFEQTMILISYLAANAIGILTVRAAGLRQRELYSALEREKTGKKILEAYAQNLAQANLDLDAYARTMANELKSGLTGIIGYTELLRGEKQDGPDRENNLTYLHKIEQAAQQLDSTVDSLLDRSRLRKKDGTD